MIKLHLGCGKRNFGKDWIHIDGGDYPHLDSYNIVNLPYEDNTVDLIYASHVIEYFDREEAVSLLQGWYKVLKVGGKLRLAVPDFNAMASLYMNGNELNKFLGPLYGKMKMDEQTIYHKTVYDFDSISTIMLDIGFRSVNCYDWRETEHANLDDHSQAYIPHMDKEKGTLISLNIETAK